MDTEPPNLMELLYTTSMILENANDVQSKRWNF